MCVSVGLGLGSWPWWWLLSGLGSWSFSSPACAVCPLPCWPGSGHALGRVGVLICVSVVGLFGGSASLCGLSSAVLFLACWPVVVVMGLLVHAWA